MGAQSRDERQALGMDVQVRNWAPKSVSAWGARVWLAGCRGPLLTGGAAAEADSRAGLVRAAPLPPPVTSCLVQEAAQNRGPRQNEKLQPLRP